MAMPAVRARPWTAAEVRQLIADNPALTPRYELVDGELLVTPSPGAPHQRTVRMLLGLLDAYLTSNRLGEVYVSPSDVELEPEFISQPDSARPLRTRPRRGTPCATRGVSGLQPDAGHRGGLALERSP